MEVVLEFIQNATVWVRAYIYDSDGNLADPTTSTKLTLTDPDGTKQVDDAAMTPDETGVYSYYYNTDSDSAVGWWSGEVWATDGTKKSTDSFSFKLKAGL